MSEPIPYNLTVPATIHESDLPLWAAVMGKANSTPVVLAGTTYAPKTLRFSCVAAGWAGNDLYKGELRYLAGDFADATDVADLNVKPAAPAKPAPAPIKSEGDK